MMRNKNLPYFHSNAAAGLRWLLVSLAAVLLIGCASPTNSRDPIEPLNRAVFSFNEGFDRAVAKPVAEGYRNVVPSLMRTGITNFFSNLEDLWIAANNLLQGKVAMAADDFGRFFLNSTFGLFGLIDVASDAGLEKHNEDFGQTLARWGVGSGAYVVLPFLGPSTVRDAVSRLAVDSQADFVLQTDHVPTRNSLYVLRGVDTRSNLLDASRVLDEAALDRYNFVRDAYLQRRRSLIYDGAPPKDETDSDRSSGLEPDEQTRPEAALERPVGIGDGSKPERQDLAASASTVN